MLESCCRTAPGGAGPDIKRSLDQYYGKLYDRIGMTLKPHGGRGGPKGSGRSRSGAPPTGCIRNCVWRDACDRVGLLRAYQVPVRSIHSPWACDPQQAADCRPDQRPRRIRRRPR